MVVVVVVVVVIGEKGEEKGEREGGGVPVLSRGKTGEGRDTNNNTVDDKCFSCVGALNRVLNNR